MTKKGENQGNRVDLDKKPYGRTFKIGRDSRMAFKDARKNDVIGKTFETDILRGPNEEVICKIDTLSGALLISPKVYGIVKEEEEKFTEKVTKRINELKIKKSSSKSNPKSQGP